MKTQIIILVIFTIFIIFMSGCNKCVEHQTGVYTFTSKDLQINPYHSHDVILLHSTSGVSLQLSAGERTGKMEEFHPHADDECRGDYAMVESNETILLSNNNSWEFSINLNFYPSQTINSYDKTITFNTSYLPNQSNYSISAIALHFGIDTIYQLPYEHSDTAIIFHKNLTIGPKNFSNAYEIVLYGQIVHSKEWASKLYYSIKQGIVGFKTRQNDTYYLE